MQLAEARADIALQAAIVEGMPMPRGHDAGFGAHAGERLGIHA
jgi:hypothetical protein